MIMMPSLRAGAIAALVTALIYSAMAGFCATHATCVFYAECVYLGRAFCTKSFSFSSLVYRLVHDADVKSVVDIVRKFLAIVCISWLDSVWDGWTHFFRQGGGGSGVGAVGILR